jgi:hypothetical protein
MGKDNTRCHSARSRQSSPDRHRLRTTEKLFGKDPKSTIRSSILHRVWFRICVEYHFWLDKDYKITWFIWIEKDCRCVKPIQLKPTSGAIHRESPLRKGYSSLQVKFIIDWHFHRWIRKENDQKIERIGINDEIFFLFSIISLEQRV